MLVHGALLASILANLGVHEIEAGSYDLRGVPALVPHQAEHVPGFDLLGAIRLADQVLGVRSESHAIVRHPVLLDHVRSPAVGW